MSPARVRYSSIEYPDFDLHVRSLWDLHQFSDEEGLAEAAGISSASWPLFGQLWPAGRTLARIMATGDFEGLRILEIGCGLALPSLVLNHRGLDVTASDHHPAVGGFLEVNSALNEDPPIPFQLVDWREETDELGSFDLLIGADLLYERYQMGALTSFLHRHCRVGGRVVLVDPGRPLRGHFCTRMAALGFSCVRRPASDEERPSDFKRAEVLSFTLGEAPGGQG